jgi:hypothetical protein
MSPLRRRLDMERLVHALAGCLVCVAGFAAPVVGAAEDTVGKVAASEAMYRVEELVGTLIATQKMYSSDGGMWYKGELRVDGAPGEGSERNAGEVLPIRYQVGRPANRGSAGLGDQISVVLGSEKAAGGEWVVQGKATVLGRGEFINPGEGAATDLGSSEARILVKLLAPLAPQCHRDTARLLMELGQQEPERVRIQIFDMMTPAGREEVNRERLHCATVLVNNRYRFALHTPEGPREVAFHRRPNGPRSLYNSEDVIAVVRQEIARLYPEQ